MLFIDFMEISASTSDTDGGGDLVHTEAGAAAQAADADEDADIQVRTCLPSCLSACLPARKRKHVSTICWTREQELCIQHLQLKWYLTAVVWAVVWAGAHIVCALHASDDKHTATVCSILPRGCCSAALESDTPLVRC